MKQPPTVPEIDRIAALSEPVARNLLITQSYWELSSAIAARTGPVANWCTFATWASKQAGQTIRKEDLLRKLEHALDGAAELDAPIERVASILQKSGNNGDVHSLRQLILNAIDPRAAMDRASGAVARGNQKVFAEIGHEFARFAGTCLADEAYDAEKIERFCLALRPGDPPDGQGLLRDAFAGYYRAFFETDAKKRAEQLLLANLLIGFHEQTRLQPEIREAMESSLVDPGAFTRRLVQMLFPYRSWLVLFAWWVLRQLGRPHNLGTAVDHLVEALRGRIRQFFTDHMMELELPAGRLHLSKDLKVSFSQNLRYLENPELLELLRPVDTTPDDPGESGAGDWGNLSDRMHFIADMFRGYQEVAELHLPPFSPDQTAAIKDFKIPKGAL